MNQIREQVKAGAYKIRKVVPSMFCTGTVLHQRLVYLSYWEQKERQYEVRKKYYV